MVDQNLVSFIRSSIQQGYDVHTIQEHLISQGYALKDVQEAVSLVYGAPHVKHTVELSKKTIITVLSASTIIIIALIFVFTSFSGDEAPATLLDLSLSSTMESVEVGEEFVFTYLSTQTGSQKRFDFKMTHEILDSSNRVITSTQEEIAIETKVSDTKSLKIPSDTKPGTYVLKSTAIYDDKKATARINFKVEGEEKEEVEEKEDPKVEEDPVVEEPSKDDPDDQEVPKVPKPKKSQQDSSSIIQDAISSAQSDLSRAGKLCDSLLEIRDRDKCFDKIAEQAQNTKLCSNIQSNSKRDTCYMNFAIEGDYSVCDKVENPYLKKSCDSLAALSS